MGAQVEGPFLDLYKDLRNTMCMKGEKIVSAII